MSMVGLFTTAAQPVGTKTATADTAAAAGFDTALNGALAALAGAGEESKRGDGTALAASAGALPASVLASSIPPAELVETTDSSPASMSSAIGDSAPMTPLVEPVETGATNSGLALTSSATEDSAWGIPPVERVETTTIDAALASTSSATGAYGGTPLVEHVETAATNAALASTSSATEDSAWGAPRGEPVETGTVDPAPASAGSATGAPPPATPPVELAGTTPADQAATGSAPVASGAATALVEPDEIAAGGRASASPGSATGAAASATPPVELVETGRVDSASASAGRPAASSAAIDAAARVAAPASPATARGTEPAPTVAPFAAATAPSVQAATPVAPPAPAGPAASVPFTTQLARPIFSLAAAGAGEHIMTVSVTPDNLGPVTVRAHVGAEGVRVELFAPNDLGREAIRAVLTDLRRDLAGAGLGGNLTLSSQNQPSGHTGAGQPGAGQSNPGQPGFEGGERGSAEADGRTPAGTASAAREPEPRRASGSGTASTIDVLA